MKNLKKNKKLKAENAELKARLGMNSSNSSLPPSSDKFVKKKERNRSLRKKSGKASGGQIGHKDSTLEKVNNPDFVVELPHDVCPHCAASELYPVKCSTQLLTFFFKFPIF